MCALRVYIALLRILNNFAQELENMIQREKNSE